METITTTLTVVGITMTIITPVIFYAAHKFLFLDITTNSNGWGI